MNNEIVGQLIEELRRAEGLKRDIVAKKAGISESKLARIESGKVDEISIQLLDKICNILGISVSGFLSKVERKSKALETDERDELYNKLVNDTSFLFLFDLLQIIVEQANQYFDRTDEDPNEIWVIEDSVTNYIMETCKLYIDEYDLFLSQNNLTYDSPSELIDKVKKETGFDDSNYASREAFERILNDYAYGRNSFTKEQIIKQLIFWEQKILFDEDAEFTDFHFKKPRYKILNFKLDNRLN